MEKHRLSNADDDIKDELRGKPETVRGYKRGIVDKTLPQNAIDGIHTGLEVTKTIADESMDFLKSKTGPVGEAIGSGYTLGSNVLEKVSEANAKFNAGTSDKADYSKAVVEGTKKVSPASFWINSLVR